MKKIYLFVLLCLCIACNRSSIIKENSPKLIEPVVLNVNGPELFQYWEIDKIDSDYILTAENGLEIYKDSLLLVLGKEKLNKILEMERSQKGAIRPLRLGLQQGEHDNYIIAHSGEVGSIRPINHLEYQLLNFQASRYSMLGHPTEFGAFILSNDSLNKLRVCYAGGDKSWPPRLGLLLDYIEEVQKKDWYLSTFLHNHFEPDSAGYVGVLAPSMTDAEYFKMLRDNFDIPNTLITNGFHTVVLDSTHFDRFKQHVRE